jgi:hypothetical protein
MTSSPFITAKFCASATSTRSLTVNRHYLLSVRSGLRTSPVMGFGISGVELSGSFVNYWIILYKKP